MLPVTVETQGGSESGRRAASRNVMDHKVACKVWRQWESGQRAACRNVASQTHGSPGCL